MLSNSKTLISPISYRTWTASVCVCVCIRERDTKSVCTSVSLCVTFLCECLCACVRDRVCMCVSVWVCVFRLKTLKHEVLSHHIFPHQTSGLISETLSPSIPPPSSSWTASRFRGFPNTTGLGWDTVDWGEFLLDFPYPSKSIVPIWWGNNKQ